MSSSTMQGTLNAIHLTKSRKNRQAPMRVHGRFPNRLIPKRLKNLQDENTQKLKEFQQELYGLILFLLFSKHLQVVTVGVRILSKKDWCRIHFLVRYLEAIFLTN